MTSAPTTPKSDPWEMALIHRLITRGFEQAHEFVVATPVGATDRTTAVTEYVRFHLVGLHAHHSSEDELLWPVLTERASLADSLISRMREQHAGLHASVEAAGDRMVTWADTPSAQTRERLAAALATLSERLEEHLVEEERDVVPLIAMHITQAEWDHLGQVAFSTFTPRQRFTAMGEMLEAAGPEEAARMTAGLPMPVRVIWRLIGHRKYSRFMNSVRGR